MNAQILPIERAAEFAHYPELKMKVEAGMKVAQQYIDALPLRVVINGKELRVLTVEYTPAASTEAQRTYGRAGRITFKGVRGGFLVGDVFFDSPSRVIYAPYGVETNRKAADLSGFRSNG